MLIKFFQELISVALIHSLDMIETILMVKTAIIITSLNEYSLVITSR